MIYTSVIVGLSLPTTMVGPLYKGRFMGGWDLFIKDASWVGGTSL